MSRGRAVRAAALATETLRCSGRGISARHHLAGVWLSLGAIWLLYFLIRHQAAARCLSLFYLTPPFTALMAWLMFNEQLSPLALVGMAVCVAASRW
jgi:drug/metabolite transporter (DMT)-like permease